MVNEFLSYRIVVKIKYYLFFGINVKFKFLEFFLKLIQLIQIFLNIKRNFMLI